MNRPSGRGLDSHARRDVSYCQTRQLFCGVLPPRCYFTLVYDLSEGPHYGRILWIKEGRDAAVLLELLDAVSQECAAGIEAVALDMALAYIAAVKAGLATAVIVFDRFIRV